MLCPGPEQSHDGQQFLAVCWEQRSLERLHVCVCPCLSALAGGAGALAQLWRCVALLCKPARKGFVRVEVRGGPLDDEPPRKGVRGRPRSLLALVLL